MPPSQIDTSGAQSGVGGGFQPPLSALPGAYYLNDSGFFLGPAWPSGPICAGFTGRGEAEKSEWLGLWLLKYKTVPLQIAHSISSTRGNYNLQTIPTLLEKSILYKRCKRPAFFMILLWLFQSCHLSNAYETKPLVAKHRAVWGAALKCSWLLSIPGLRASGKPGCSYSWPGVQVHRGLSPRRSWMGPQQNPWMSASSPVTLRRRHIDVLLSFIHTFI